MIYVDNFRVPATVAGTRARWSHLTADTPEELHEFAEKIGLKRAWFQGKCKMAPGCPKVDGICRHFHYDVTDRVRDTAIQRGAKSIDLREFGAIVSARAERFRPCPDCNAAPGVNWKAGCEACIAVYHGFEGQ